MQIHELPFQRCGDQLSNLVSYTIQAQGLRITFGPSGVNVLLEDGDTVQYPKCRLK
jgi:hypothetical protein